MNTSTTAYKFFPNVQQGELRMSLLGYKSIFQVVSDTMKWKLIQFMFPTFHKAIILSNSKAQL